MWSSGYEKHASALFSSHSTLNPVAHPGVSKYLKKKTVFIYNFVKTYLIRYEILCSIAMCYLSSDRFILLFVKIKTRKKKLPYSVQNYCVALFFIFVKYFFLSKLKAIVLIQYEIVSGVAIFYTNSNSQMVLTQQESRILEIKVGSDERFTFFYVTLSELKHIPRPPIWG